MACRICNLDIKAAICKPCNDMDEVNNNFISQRPHEALAYFCEKYRKAWEAVVRDIAKTEVSHG